MLEIKGKSVVLREFTETELYNPEYFKWLRNYNNIKYIYRLEYLKSLSFDSVKNHINLILNSSDNSLLAIYENENSNFIGTLKIGHINWRTGIADIGIMIGDENFKGKGLSKESITIACDYAFKWLGLRKITAGTFENNFPMIKCFEKVGFIIEGRKRKELLVDGSYIDHILFGLFKEEFYTKHQTML